MNEKNGENKIETHALKITHEPEELLNRKSYRSTLSGNPLWSLPDGAIRYVHPFPGFKGGHPLSCSLIYDSMMPYLVKEKFPMLPEGFKISGLSCMADATVDGNASYLYLDGNGVVHAFVPYEDGDSLFHDKEGMGLVYDPNENVLDDGFGTKITFDGNGRIKEASKGDTYVVSYEYDKNGKLITLLDKTGGMRHFEFFYNGLYLSEIRQMYGEKLLVAVSFSYKTKLVMGSMIPWLLEGVSLTDTSNDIPCLHVNYGDALLRDDPKVNGIDDYVSHQGFRVEASSGCVSRIAFSPVDKDVSFRERTYITRTEKDNIVTLKNRKGISYAYLLDTRGYLASVFETDGDGTLLSDTGKEGFPLVLEGDSKGIDAKPYGTCSRNSPLKLTEYTDSTGNHLIRGFTIDYGTALSVYVRLEEGQSAARVSATGFLPVALDPYGVGVWQKAVLPFGGPSMPETMEVSVTDNSGRAFSADIALPRIVYREIPRLSLSSGMVSFGYLKKGTERIIGNVTLSDFLRSFSNYHESDHGTKFLFLNGGKDMVPVHGVTFDDGNGNDVLFTEVFSENPITLVSATPISGAKKAVFFHYDTKEKEKVTYTERLTKDDELISSVTEKRKRYSCYTKDASGIERIQYYYHDGLFAAEVINGITVQEYTYDGDGNVTEERKGESVMKYTYEFGRPASVYDGLVTKRFSYDIFGRESGVAFADPNGDNEYLYNGLTLNAVKDQASKAEFPCDYDKDSSEYIVDGNMLEKHENLIDLDTTTYSGYGAMLTRYDRYGRMTDFTDSNNSTIGAGFGYEKTEYAPSSARLKMIEDGFSSRRTEFFYGKDGSPDSVLVSNMSDGSTVLEKISDHSGITMQYRFGKYNSCYTKTVKEEQSKRTITYEDKLGRQAMIASYTLDSMGRIDEKKSPIRYTYNYESNYNLVPFDIICPFYEAKIEYLNQRRVTDIKYSGKVNMAESYSYDSLGKLSTASKTYDGKSYQRGYLYDKGKLWKITKCLELTRDSNGRMTAFNDLIHGKTGTFSYDSAGNVIQYGDMGLIYESGHRLRHITGLEKTVDYEYSYDGMRCRKVIDGEKTEFIYDGSKLIGEELSDGRELSFFYDGDDPLGFSVKTKDENEVYYVYVKDVLGSIIGIVKYGGLYIGSYVYDEKGIILETVVSADTEEGRFIMEVNPFRYRGYFYDTETGFYYLQSRYYDPVTMSFLSPDEKDCLALDDPNGIDPYCYCLYDPVNNVDPTGRFLLSTALIAATLGAIVGFAFSIGEEISDYGLDIKKWNWWKIFFSTFYGFCSGFVSTLPGGWSLLGSLVIGGISNITNDALDGKIHSAEDGVLSVLSGVVSSAISYGIFRLVSLGLSQVATYIADHCPYKSLISFMVLTDKIDDNAKKPKTFVEKFSHHIAYLILDQWGETKSGMVFGDVFDEVIGMIGWDFNEKEQTATL